MANPSPDALSKRLVDLSFMIEQAREDSEVLDEEVVKAKAAHRVAYARAFLNATGPMDQRTQIAIEQAEPERFAWDTAEQKYRSCKERMRTLREQLDITQSLSAIMRSEWGATR